MFQPWRLQLRQAEQAMRAGRLDEAQQLLGSAELREFLPAKRLMSGLVGRYVARGQERVQKGETSAGWHDFEAAAALGAEEPAVSSLKQQLVDRTLAEAGVFLEAGDADAALNRLADLTKRRTETRASRAMKQAATKMSEAQRFARKGRFGDAEQALTEAISLCPELKRLPEVRERYRQHATEARQCSQRLHEALAAKDWNQVLAMAERILDVAPEDNPARDARRRAWAAVGTELVDSQRGRGPAPIRAGQAFSPSSTPNGQPIPLRTYNPATPVVEGEAMPRFLLWIDAVGGYLVCPSSQVVLGQPGQTSVDIPILGDVSGRHAIIRRVGEGYLLAALRPTKVDGQPVTEETALADGNVIELGEGVRFRFRKPHPLSLSAFLEVTSRHRLQPPVDGVILMAESCVLGPSSKAHVRCQSWTREVVLYRQGEQLACRTTGGFEIDDVRCDGNGLVRCSSRIAGDDFSLSLEELQGG